MSTLDDILNFGDEPKKNNNNGGGENNGFYKKNDGSVWVNNQENNTPTNTPTPTPQTQTTTAKVENPTQTANNNNVTTSVNTETPKTTITAEQKVGGENNDDDEEIEDWEPTQDQYDEMNGLTKQNTPKTISAVQKQAQESATKARNFENMIAQIYDAEMKRNAVDYDPEKEKKERKRQKRNELFAAIGDGISALANMWGTYHGARDMYDPKNSMSDRVRKRYEQLKAEKEKKRQNYLNAASGKYQLLKGRESADAASATAETNANLAREKAQQRAQEHADDMEYKGKKLGIEAAGVQAKINSTNQSHDLGVQRLAETKRHNGVMEHNATVRENRLANGGGSGSGSGKDYRTLTLRNGQVIQYNKRYIGALNRLAPKMIEKARAAAERYRAVGNIILEDRFETLANSLESVKSTDGINSLVASNIADFPSLQDDAKKILGVGKYKENGGKAQTTKKKATNTSTTSGYGGINY